jgi:hypothetical protein
LLGAPVPELADRLAERGLRRPIAPDATLRERFGLPRPPNFYARPPTPLAGAHQ